jgi:hypothetical protein
MATLDGVEVGFPGQAVERSQFQAEVARSLLGPEAAVQDEIATEQPWLSGDELQEATDEALHDDVEGEGEESEATQAEQQPTPEQRAFMATNQAWHGFRRGLATNLNRMGVQDKTIQAILRHSNVSTTTNVYIKSVDADVVSAMNALEAELCAERAPGTAVFPARVVN